MRRRTLAVISLAVGSLGVVVVSASPASAALCAKWDPPVQGVVGSVASISFRTYVPISTDGDAYTLEPRAFPDYPFKVHAISPQGATSMIEMAPGAEDDRRWLGDLTPDHEGPWTLTIVNLQGGDALCYGDAILMVERGPRSRTPTFAVLGFFAILGGVAGYSSMRRRRSRLGAGAP